jgi:hypothetical protein
MHYTACVYCNKLVRVKELPQKGYDTVCSKECHQKELDFRRRNSDEQIGLRNYRDHGVNPNHRGKRNGTPPLR